MIEKFQGIVIRNVKYTDSDRILTVFTKKFGKVSIMAKGANRVKGKVSSATQLFTLSEFICYKGKKMYTLNSAEYITGFYALQNDVERLAYASYIAELVDNFYINDSDSAEPLIFNLLVYCFNLLQKTEVEKLSFICLAFILKMIGIFGSAPNLETCSVCGEKKENMCFNIEEGGLCCNECSQITDICFSITKEEIGLINELLYIPIEKLKIFDGKGYSTNICMHLIRIFNEYCIFITDKRTNSFDFLINML